MTDTDIVVDNLPEARRLPFTSSWSWVREAWTHFRAAPLLWMSATGVYMLSLLPALTLPVLGALLSAMANALIMAGMMLIGHRQRHLPDYRPRVIELFEPLRVNAAPLIRLALLSFALNTLVMVILVQAITYSMPTELLSQLEQIQHGKLQPSDAELLVLGEKLTALWPLGIVLALGVLLMQSISFFAVPLMVLRGCSAWLAIRLSISAYWRNIGAIISLLLMMVVGFMLSALSMYLALLVLLPVFMLCNYTSYRQMFD